MRLLAWDLETSNLSASFGTIICAGFKTVGAGRPTVLSIDRYEGDALKAEKALLKDLSAALLDCDCWLTWYGTYFDIPYLNTRLLYHKLPVLPATFPHIDGWKTARNRLKLGNNRLNTVQGFLGLKDEKTHIKGEMWIRALTGHRASMRYLVRHCSQDVLVLEQAYERLRPLIIDHPNQGLVKRDAKCPVCGGRRLQKRGLHVARSRAYQRMHCQQCGAWSKRAKEEAIPIVYRSIA